jgi:hypothetical protein
MPKLGLDLDLEGGRVKNALPINTQTGTGYTLALEDEGKLLIFDNTAAITLTVPTNATVAFPIGAQIMIYQLGSGQVTTVGDTGVTIEAYNNEVKTKAQYSVATLIKRATDTWILTGDLI